MENTRKIIDTNIKSGDLARYKSEGLTPYYYSQNDNNFGLIEYTKPLSGRDYDNKPKVIYLLTQEEYDKVLPLVNNIKELIDLTTEKIKTYKKMVPAVIQELIK